MILTGDICRFFSEIGYFEVRRAPREEEEDETLNQWIMTCSIVLVMAVGINQNSYCISFRIMEIFTSENVMGLQKK